ncbi:GNAT family N-acetyltransferase [Saccharibacillus sp. CPCC 101409]|uniref:GNAT family N-acetyltransferase n=1 Tax=Saccharibacillus sp. CPCC 101409 TaxID=3058041 RepID=UPI0026721B29|nr:GNAT family N-acetyltransferase [Saccharibacillus sp. CPCC 101409]MDO3411589.1 GNAT family N-acetyltransferase [Saccharibacillus sp. CPCC 101409]
MDDNEKNGAGSEDPAVPGNGSGAREEARGNAAEIETRRITFGSPEYAQGLRLRDEVLRRPLGMNIANDDLSGDAGALHAGAFAGERLVGTLLLRALDERTLQMKQVAVNEALRGAGIGRRLVEYAERLAAEQGYDAIVLNARDVAVAFYEKLGYAREGEMFTEIGIPHYRMRKAL